MVKVLKMYMTVNGEVDVRRVAVTEDVLTVFATLHQKVMSVYQPTTSDLIITWIDSEGDRIKITSDEELAQAVANAGTDLIRLYITLANVGNLKKDIPQAENGQVLHPHVVCDHCDKEISGFRYKCLECQDYDLCSGCNASDVHPAHDMVKLARPTYIARKWLFQGAPRMWKSMFQPSINRFYKSHFQETNDAGKTDKCSSSTEPKEANDEMTRLCHFFPTLIRKTAADLPEALKEMFPAQLLDDGFNEVAKLLEAIPRCQQAASTSTSAQTTAESPANLAKPSQPDAPSSGNAETGLESPAENTPMDIGNNQTPKEVEDAECIDEIIVDPENGTTQTQEQPKLPEGWTLLDADLTSSRMDCGPTSCGEAVPKPAQTVVYPNLSEVVDPAPKPQENSNFIRSRDPKIRNAVMTMQGMGFSNEGGWLESLLASKNGNINETLESLYPTMR